MSLFNDAGLKIAMGFFGLVLIFIIVGVCILAISELGIFFLAIIGIGIAAVILSFLIGNLIWYLTGGDL